MTDNIKPQFKVRSNLRAGEGGGYVNGVYYPDQSGICGGSTPPTPPEPVPPVNGGGYVNGVYYSDKSGACG